DLGVRVFDSLKERRLVKIEGKTPKLTRKGESFCMEIGIDVAELRRQRRPMCRVCLDWSVRRHHLAGAVGAGVLGRLIALGVARRASESRVVDFSTAGERNLREHFPVARSS